ncbi:hypothetical protein BGZ83_003455, partial [Gryganskiella cystojenkinii]
SHMGCHNLFVMIHKKGLPMVSVDLKGVRQADYSLVEYDVLAMELMTIRRYAISIEYFLPDGTIDYKRAMQDAAAEIIKGIRIKLHDLLFGADPIRIKVVMHVDGGASDAKGLEHRKRQKTKEAACCALNADIKTFKKRQGIKEIGVVGPTVAVSVADPWSPLKVIEKIKKNLGKACVIPLEYKTALSEALTVLVKDCSEFDLTSHVCHGEADP